MSNQLVLSRRALLAGLGAVTASGLVVTPGRRAHAAPPTRLIVVHVPEGMWNSAQKPAAGGTQLGPILEALQPYQSKLNVLLNLNMKSRDNGPGGDGHHRGVPHMFTCTEMLDEDNAGGASVDQKIASVIGKGLPFGSLQFAVRIVYGDTNGRPIWSGPGKVVPAMQSPWDAYKRIFSNVSAMPAGGTMPTTPTAPKVDLRKSALDNALVETAALRARLGAKDRALLDTYQDSLRDIERRLTSVPQGAAAATTGCTPPMLGASMDVKSEANYPAVGRLQMDMMVAALQCNLTRVCSLQWGNSNDQCTYSFLGVNTLGHDMAHNNNDCDPSGAKKLKVYKWYSEQAAYLLGKLAAIPEGDGTMLDNTAILWASEFSNSEAHASDKLMWMVMGNVAGFFKQGQVIDTKGKSVNDLLTSLCNAYGLPDKTFGNPAYCAGPLTGISV